MEDNDVLVHALATKVAVLEEKAAATAMALILADKVAAAHRTALVAIATSVVGVLVSVIMSYMTRH